MPIHIPEEEAVIEQSPLELGVRSVPARCDPNCRNDPIRIKRNLIACQPKDIRADCFEEIQDESRPWMRNEVAQWLLEVAELEECCGSVFPGAVQLFDRYLSKVTILPCQLQVTAITCLLIISKIFDVNPIQVRKCVAATDHTTTASEIRDLEISILCQFSWNVSCTSRIDILAPLMTLMRFSQERTAQITTRARFVIDISCLEQDLNKFSPAVVTAACICFSLRGIRLRARRQDELVRLVSARLGFSSRDIHDAHQSLQNSISRWRQNEHSTPNQVDVWF